MNVGVLALQGCVDPHVRMLERIGATAIRVRTPAELAKVDRIILPGGESSTMLRLLDKAQLFTPLKEFTRCRPTWGICAGAILLAQEVRHPEQTSLGAIAIRATRNFYGSQTESFKKEIEIDFLKLPVLVDFIRAPLLEALSPDVTVHAKQDGQTILLHQKNVLVSSFHVELGEDTRLHEYFIESGDVTEALTFEKPQRAQRFLS